MTQTDQELDRIERSIDIDATPERVWALVARPGWWINEQEVEPDPVIRYEDGAAILVHAKWGEFRIETVESREPEYLAYKWVEPDTGGAGSLVEFWIDPRPGGVTLKVVESGLTTLGKSHDELVQRYEGNSEGWTLELAAAQRFVLGAGS